MNPRRLSWLLIPVVAALAAGCQKQGGPGGHAMGAPPPPAVTVAPVEQREIVEWEELTGRTAPVEFVEVRPRVSGHLEEVRFESGQLVKKGDVLFTIDARWHQAEFDRREAEFIMARVRVENTQREAARNAQLLASRAVSKEEADARDARYQEARAGLLAAEAARNSAKLDLEFTQIRAPIDGRVSRALVTVGNYVSGVAGAANLLTTIVSVDPMYVYADMDENALLKFYALSQAGKLMTNSEGKVPVDLQLGDEASLARKGYIESLDNRLDPQSGSIVVRAVFSNPRGRVLPGLFTRLRIPASANTPVLLVDEGAIATDQAQKYVLTLTSTNTAAYRPVKLGPVIDGKRVVREGLQPGEKVIVNGLARVRPGLPVAPQDDSPAGKPASTAQR